MREIKFRAWDRIGKRMLNWGELLQLNLQNIFRNICGMTLLQYTGLKDRCGVEIYEGDILELINEADRRVNAICKFGKRRLIHTGYTIEIQGFYFEVEGRKTNPVVCNYKGMHDLEIMEIRGNIYENPELLGGGEC